MSLDVGQVLGGKYAVERVIGHGVFGAVYQGCDQSSNQRVAIRLIVPEFDNEQIAGFIESDARAAGQLSNEHLARLINIGFLPSGERCIISELVEGETLANRVKRQGRLPEDQVAALLVQVLDGLVAAHRAGVVHRDLTPSSILVASGPGSENRATLIDFGISRFQALRGDASAARAAGLETASLQYLSPEQLTGLREIDARSNIYSLGTIAYEAMTGRRPFEDGDFTGSEMGGLEKEPAPVEEFAPESSSSFVQLIRKAMARLPNARFQSADEMSLAVANWLSRAGGASVRSKSPASTPPMPSSVTRADIPASRAPQGTQQEPTAPVTAETVPSAIPPVPEIRLPPSARVAAVLAAASATPPPPPPMDPTAADIDQSVVDALFAPPPMSADADLPAADDWEHPSHAPAPKSAPSSARPSSRFDSPRSRPSSPFAAPPPSSPANRQPLPTPRTAVVVPSVKPEAAMSSGPDSAAITKRAATSVLGADAALAGEQDSPVSSRPPSSSAPTQPYTALPDEVDETREKRTIIGLGGYGNYPLPPPSSPTASAPVQEAPPSQRPALGTTPGIQPIADATTQVSASGAPVPQQQTETQNVAASMTPASGVPIVAPPTALPSEPPAPIAVQPAQATPVLAQPAQAAPIATQAVPVVVPAAVQATAVSAAPLQQQAPSDGTVTRPQQAAASAASPAIKLSVPPNPAPAASPPASLAVDALDDLGPYGKSRSRSRKSIIAILLVVLLGAGATVVLLQGRSEAPQPEPSQARAMRGSPRVDEPLQPKPAPVETQAEVASPGTSGASLSQAVNAGLHAPGAQAKKPASSTKPAVVTKPVAKSTGAVLVPTKPAGSKSANDPYKYR